MKQNTSVSFTYALAKNEIDNALALSIPELLGKGIICKNDIIELFGPRSMDLAGIPYNKNREFRNPVFFNQIAGNKEELGSPEKNL